MPYLLTPKIKKEMPGLWGESNPYTSSPIFEIKENALPPVNYNAVNLKSHSLTHIESELHVVKNGKTIDDYFNNLTFFYGPTVVVKIKNPNYQRTTHDNIFHFEVNEEILSENINRVLKGRNFPGKILLTTDNYPENEFNFHDPNFVLTISPDAAEYLNSFENFNLYGTSWKSSDYNPGSTDRPIHKLLFKKAIILELLSLNQVPEGIYFLSSPPIYLEGASESPVSPMLFTNEELAILK
jgi:arylformamidase